MGSSEATINLELVPYLHPRHPPSKPCTYPIALATIMSIGGIGFAAYYQVQSLNIYGFAILMGVSGGGLICSIQEYYKISSSKKQPRSFEIEMNRLDPTIVENACKILNIPLDQRSNQAFIIKNYAKILRGLEIKHKRCSHSRVVSNAIQKMIDDVKNAYTTLSTGDTN